MKKAYRVHAADNVAMLLEDVSGGDAICVAGKGAGDRAVSLVAGEAVRAGHKIALAAIAPGEPVLKYGTVIGAATRGIAAGMHVHVHNLGGLRGRGDT